MARRGRDAAGTGPRLETVPQEKVGECENPVGRGCLPRPQGSREASEAGPEGARAGDEMGGGQQTSEGQRKRLWLSFLKMGRHERLLNRGLSDIT